MVTIIRPLINKIGLLPVSFSHSELLPDDASKSIPWTRMGTSSLPISSFYTELPPPWFDHLLPSPSVILNRCRTISPSQLL